MNTDLHQPVCPICGDIALCVHLKLPDHDRVEEQTLNMPVVRSEDLQRHINGQALAVLRELNDSLPQVDNGHCAICRIGYRSYDTKGKPRYNCSNEDCISHRIRAVLDNPPPSASRDHPTPEAQD